MKTERIIEELAKVEGIDIEHEKHIRRYIQYSEQDLYPRYPESHDAVQRVIDGLAGDVGALGEKEMVNFIGNLSLVCSRDGVKWTYRASPLQKCEAILRALGKWEEEAEA